jgi:hypothetical protein
LAKLIEIDGEVGKHCTKCNEWQPLENYQNSKTASDGRKPRCKECCRIDKGAKKRKHIAKLIEIDGIIGKDCGICKEWMPLDKFLDRKSGAGGKRSDCIECERVRSLQYFYDHKDECRKREQDWAVRNPDKRLEKLRRWYANNPDKITENNHKRLARKRSLPNTFTTENMKELLEIFGGCALTGDFDIHWDHVIPLATGKIGTVKGNMIPLRKDLNVSKSDGNIFEWFSANCERFNLSKEKFDKLINDLAIMNGMSVNDYRSFVYSCFENKREVI